MNEEKQYTEQEIREMATKFFNECLKELFPPDIICEACGVENCPCNEICICCGCQL